MSPVESIGTKVAEETILFLLPKGWAWLMNEINGQKILIVGPGRSGKTSFKNYLSKGILLNETETSKTQLHSKSKGTIIRGNNGSFEIQVKSLTDSPGQIGPIVHADSVLEFMPHILFIFLNCQEIKESLIWFQDFSECLYAKFRDFPILAKKIKSIIIILNKVDLIEGDPKKVEDTLSSFQDKVKKIAMEEWKHVYYRAGGQNKVPLLLPAICVKKDNSKKFLEEIINTLAYNF